MNNKNYVLYVIIFTQSVLEILSIFQQWYVHCKPNQSNFIPGLHDNRFKVYSIKCHLSSHSCICFLHGHETFGLSRVLIWTNESCSLACQVNTGDKEFYWLHDINILLTAVQKRMLWLETRKLGLFTDKYIDTRS